jgi:predicted phage terminase large subunit-like protein
VNSDFTACSTCQVERLASTLDGNGQCPFCVDEGVPPPVPPTPPAPDPKVSKITVVPSKNAGPRAKPDAPPIPRAARAEDQQAVNEAYTLPYAAPIFDIKKAEADPAKELALRALCRRRLLPFVQRFRPKYLAGWVHEDICRRLERFVRAVEAGESPRLLLLLPPRSGKSELGSRNFPPWVLGQHPDWEIIAASHTQSLTLSFSRYVRDLVRDPAYKAIFPDLMLDPASQSIENWNTLQGGGYMAAGVGTGISGRGCFSRNTLLRSHTLSDILPISHVRVGEMVYGYDHRTGCVKEVEVLAISLMRTRKQLYAIEDVVCTDDHYFHTPDERSYTRARALDSNMSLLRRTEVQGVENVPCVLLPEPADTLDWQGMPEVRGQEGRPRIRVQKLPHGASTSRPHRDSDLHALRKDVRAESSRARGGDQEIRRAGHLLLDGVLPGSSKARDEGEGSVRGVRGTSEEVGSEKVLLAYLLPGHKEGSVYENDLQPGLLNAEEAPDQPEGSCLRDVRAEDVPSGGAPHRPRPGAQQGRELGAVVLSVSQVVSHTRGVCAGDLEAFVQDEDGELVVDIQTETGNFFVGVADLLAHNCHILVVDDVVKDAEAADSVTIRENTWEWYISTAYTRLAPGGGVLGILTWWHEDDWAGRIQDVMKSGDGDVFEVVKYPAINEEGDEYILPDDTIQQFAPESDPPPEGSRLTRLRGTAIHPARYTTAMMLKIKMNLISSGLKRVWNALYQQNPVPDDGVYFTKEMMRWYTHPPRRQDMFLYQAWDFAITEKTDSDWTVCCTLGQDEADNLYVLHILRFRSGDGNAIVDDILDQYEMFKPDLIGFEDGQIWKSLTSQFKKRCDERKLYPNSELLQPLTDKKVRAGPLKGRMQNGKLFVRQNQPWTEPFRQEFMKFPSGKYDDQIDATAWCVRLTLTKSAPKAKAPPPQKSWKDKLRELTSGQGGHMAA